MQDSTFSSSSAENGSAETAAPFAEIGVIGAGAWGTALSLAAARGGASVRLWARSVDHADELRAGRVNERYLPGATLDDRISITSEPADLDGLEACLFVAPAQAARGVLNSFAPIFQESVSVLMCCKGLETATGALMSDILGAEIPTARRGVLSGPGFAGDVARGLPTAVTIACDDQADALRWVATLGHGAFRPYRSDDLTGVQIGGALKNVYAIACGAVEGAGLGESAKAALISRAFAEMTRLADALGAQAETLKGLSGLGDLVLTCTSPQSRNYAFGVELGRGRKPADVLKSRSGVVEGAPTAQAVRDIAAKASVDLPIASCVAQITRGEMTVSDAARVLLDRPFKTEF